MSLDSIEQLAQAIVAHRAVLVLGTGVTAYVTGGNPVATWGGLLRDGIARTASVHAATPRQCERQLAELDELGGVDEHLMAATFIEAKLGRETSRFDDWIRQTIGALLPVDDRLIPLLDSLGAPFITTNYDDIVAKQTGRRTSTWRDGSAVGSLLRDHDARIVHHLHGIWDRPETIILGTRSYTEIVGHQQIQDSLKAIALTRPLIFIGCGATFDDPNLGPLFEWLSMHHSATAGRHYRLSLNSEADVLRSRHKSDSIDVVPYGRTYDDLVPYISRLAHRVGDLRGASTSMPATVAAKPPVWCLPAATLCLGRTEEIDRVVGHLCAPRSLPVPILGGPGIGKSTISVGALHHPDVVERFEHRRGFVRCDGLSDPTALFGRIAEAIGTPAGPSLEERVIADLASAPAALALDNFETPWEPDPERAEAELLRLCSIPTVALIVSIRSWEKPFGPEWAESIDVRRLDSDTAEELFLRTAGQRFKSDLNLQRVLAIAEGVPLAIVLLAHRADGEPNLAAFWRLWEEQRSRLLERTDVKGPRPLNNLAASLELSITASPRMARQPGARRLLSVLAHLPEGVAHNDLAQVFADEPQACASTLRKLGLVVDERDRIRLLAPIAEHVKLQHPANPEDQQRSMRFYAELAANHGPRVGSQGGSAAAKRLEPEIGNLEAAIMALSTVDLSAAVRACVGLVRFHRVTGLASAHAAAALADHACQIEYIPEQAECLKCLGDIALDHSAHDEARSRYEAAISLYRAVNDRLGEASCIMSIGDIALRRSDLNAALSFYLHAKALYETECHSIGEANCIQSIGDISLQQAQYDDAMRHYADAIPLYRRENARVGEANCLKGIGDVASEKREFETARRRFHEALELYKDASYVLGEANCLRSAGECHLECDEFDEAERLIRNALPLHRVVKDVMGEANCIRALAKLAMNRREFDLAYSLAMDSRSLHMRIGDLLGQADSECLLGDIHWLAPHPQNAIDSWTIALSIYAQVPNPHHAGQVHRRLGRALAGAKQTEHIVSAHDAWRSINRHDLIAQLRSEFPGDCPAEDPSGT